MGRWDGKPTRDYDVNKPSDDLDDEWNRLNNSKLDWRETHANDHPKGCNCPKHEEIKNMAKSRRTTGDKIKLKLCPEHYKAWVESKPEMYKKAKWYQKIILWLALRLGWLEVIELKYANSDLCFWCKFGSGGRGIKTDPYAPDMPPA